MNKKIINEILSCQIKLKNAIKVTVSGVSMYPLLIDGDIITIEKTDEYAIGDIVVFIYKYDELVVHRLLKIKDGTYFCKGDNSFRLEDLKKEQIIGKVILKNDRKLPNYNQEFVDLSLKIGEIFRACKYDYSITKQSDTYLTYKRIYLDENNVSNY